MNYIIHGWLGLSFIQDLIVLIVLTQITILSVTLYLHRTQAHRALDLHPAISHFFRFWLWMTTGMSTKAWTAIHRKHHAKCETEEDPHSPVMLGIKTVFWNGAELYRKEAINQETLDRYGQGTPDDWMEKNIYTRHGKMGISLMLLIDIVLFGLPGITVWALQMIWIPLFAAGVINGIGHYFGYRNYDCPDQARNIIPMGIFLAGEELHNNHHTFGSSAKFSSKWWEIDLGWGFITVLNFLKLASIKKLPPVLVSDPLKKEIDGETLKAIILNKFVILSKYTKDVIKPIRKSNAIEIHKKHMLNHVQQCRDQLQDIWSRTSASQKELLDALRQWCKNAEESGIHALRDFALRLKSYVPKAV